MIDCTNVEVRELLPDMLHGSLAIADRRRVDAHLQSCSACREELDLLRQVNALFPARQIDAARITRGISPYRRRSRFADAPLMRIAAGIAIVALGGASYGIVSRSGWNESGNPESTYVVASGDSSMPSTGITPDSIVVSSDIASMDDEAVAEMMSRLESLDASFPLEPRRLVRNPQGSGNLE